MRKITYIQKFVIKVIVEHLSSN